jgi:hypothetical protein
MRSINAKSSSAIWINGAKHRLKRVVTVGLIALGVSGCSNPAKNCRFWETGVALTKRAPSAEPVMFVHSACSRVGGGIEIKTEYVDLRGAKWPESELEIDQTFITDEHGEFLTEKEVVERYARYRELIASYAICNKLVPTPAWFKGSCEQ